MITDIGIVAGNILELLENRNGVLVFGEIHVDLKQPRDLVLMSLGWLIREGCVKGIVGTNEVFVFHLPKETASTNVESFCHV